MKKLFVFFALTCLVSILTAQTSDSTSAWKKEMIANLHFTQNSFDNWAQGGEDAWSWLLNMNGNFTKVSPKTDWSTQFKISYGETKLDDEPSRKSSDEIKFESILTYALNSIVNPYAGIAGWSQFAKGYVYTGDSQTEVSGFLDPGYFILSAGASYTKGETFKTRLGAALKNTVADKHAFSYTDNSTTSPLEKSTNIFGMESVTDATLKLGGTLLLKSKLELFSDLSAINTVDVNWDNQFSAQVSKYISAGLNIRLLYDRDISIRRQLKQIMSAGLTYSFF